MSGIEHATSHRMLLRMLLSKVLKHFDLMLNASDGVTSDTPQRLMHTVRNTLATEADSTQHRTLEQCSAYVRREHIERFDTHNCLRLTALNASDAGSTSDTV